MNKRRNHTVALAICALAAALIVTRATTVLGARQPTVTICHHEEGEEPRTITIPQSALAAHLAHGDTIGPCPDDSYGPPPPMITICHCPTSGPYDTHPCNPRTITIPVTALAAHLAHGDTIGPCSGYYSYGGGGYLFGAQRPDVAIASMLTVLGFFTLTGLARLRS
jgi:hypothetical protein